MLLELLPVLALPALLVLAAWAMARRRRSRTGGPFIDVPDAPPGSQPDDAPGAAGPYSSLDPWAPPKEPVDMGRSDRRTD